MFKFHFNRRRSRSATRCHSQLSRRAFRPMRLEPMEGRLMLSANASDSAVAAEYTTLNLHAAQWTLDANDQPAIVASTRDGGFVGTSYSSAGAAFDGNIVSPDGVPAAAGIVVQSINRAVLSTSGTSDTWSLFDSIDTIRPVAIVLDRDGEINSAIEQTWAETMGPRTAREEGGAIQIESILARVGTMEAPRTSELVSRASIEVTARQANRAAQSTAPATSADRAAGGELARAIVFEMAGGEPVARERPEADNRSEPQAGVEVPLSSTDSHETDAARSLARAAGARAENRPTSRDDLVDPDFERLREPIFGVQRNERPLRPTSDGSTSVAAGAETLDAGLLMSAGRVTDSVLAEAFEQLGESEGSTAFSLVDYSRRALGATPLLLMLALERIAARNSRRAAKHAAAASWGAEKRLPPRC